MQLIAPTGYHVMLLQNYMDPSLCPAYRSYHDWTCSFHNYSYLRFDHRELYVLAGGGRRHLVGGQHEKSLNSLSHNILQHLTCDKMEANQEAAGYQMHGTYLVALRKMYCISTGWRPCERRKSFPNQWISHRVLCWKMHGTCSIPASVARTAWKDYDQLETCTPFIGFQLREKRTEFRVPALLGGKMLRKLLLAAIQT
jgi:hypothetical protein